MLKLTHSPPPPPKKKGCVLLDVGGDDFPTIANEIVSSLVLGDMIPQKAADSVLKILLRKHKHRSDATLWDRLKQSALDPGRGGGGMDVWLVLMGDVFCCMGCSYTYVKHVTTAH